jgi:hypothetical protein
MVKDLVRSVKAFLAQKTAVANRERQLIEDLNRVLPEIGYRVVPAGRETATMPTAAAPAARPSGARNGRQQSKSGAKALACPHCDRRFARPLHLGRHLSATHSRGQSRGQSRKKKAA